jgi:hypothetical protein
MIIFLKACNKNSCSYVLTWSRGSAVGIATGYFPNVRRIGLPVPEGSRIVSTRQRPYRFWSPFNLLSNGYRGPGIKRPGLEADYLPPTSAEANQTWICTSTPPYAFMA